MKIAIAAPCPQPFVIGGAEKLWWGLARYINDATADQADVIKLPVTETGFWSLLDGYRRFSRLDLSGFDVVISGKYPAWMVAHPRHVVYMLHPARGLYEGYAGPSLEDAWPQLDVELRDFVEFLRSYAPRREHLDAVFDRLAALCELDRGRGGTLVSWPGPVAREAIRWLDAVALAPDAIVRYAAIARGLTRRADYFPAAADVAIAHPPSDLDIVPGSQFRYFLSVSRLETYKRVALVVEAMRWVKGDVELWVAGTGPEEARLRELAAGDGRIRFLGFVSDSALVDLYRDALAVPFVPYQEDYGLITVEAMQAGKPVITSEDAGGPTELVRDGENGYVVAPTAEAIGGALQRLAGDEALARRLGAAGRQRAASITWPTVVDALFPVSPANALPDGAARGANAASEARASRMVDLAVPWTGPEQRRTRKAALAIERALVLVIGGAGAHAGALLQDLCFIARALPQTAFVLPDFDADAIDRASLPPNLAVPGTPSGAARGIMFEAADAALCLSSPRAAPLRHVLHCLACGIPVVAAGDVDAWPQGLRAHVFAADSLAEIPATIAALLRDDAASERATRAARAFLEHSADDLPAAIFGASMPAATRPDAR